jgi:hypothetical protein
MIAFLHAQGTLLPAKRLDTIDRKQLLTSTLFG